MTTANAINGKTLTGLSAVDGKTLSGLSAVDGVSVGVPIVTVAEIVWSAYQVGGISDGTNLTAWSNVGTAAGNYNLATHVVPPVYRATLGPGSRPTIQFDGSTQALGFVFSQVPGPTPITVLAVVKLSDSTNRSILGHSSNGGLQYRAASLKQSVVKQGVADVGSSSTNLSTSAFQSIGMDYDGSTLHFFLSGSADGTISNSQSFSSQINRVGLGFAGEYWSDYISEIRIFFSVINSTVRAAEQANLTAIWGV
jgi:hypothetical protein